MITRPRILRPIHVLLVAAALGAGALPASVVMKGGAHPSWTRRAQPYVVIGGAGGLGTMVAAFALRARRRPGRAGPNPTTPRG